jgi:pimeloyl-ACP methyl ester carboxylesterase
MILVAILCALVLLVLALVIFTLNISRRVEAAFPPRGAFMEIDGQRIHYLDSGGTGPAIVMIHGLAGNMLNFSYVLERLTKDFRVVAIDRPGSGYSTRPARISATLGTQAQTVATLIRALGLKRPLLVGHSLGGALALAIALDHPDCAGGLALLSPLTRTQAEVSPVFRTLGIASPLLRRIVAMTLATPMRLLRRDSALKLVFGPDAVPKDFAAKGGGLLGLRSQAFINTSRDFVAVMHDHLPAMIARYGTLTIPLGMLFGTGDHILDYRLQGEAMKADCPALDLELIEGGHMLLATKPEQAEAVIRRVATKM